MPDLIATLRNVEAAYVEWKRIAGIKRKQQQLHTLEEETRLTRWFEPVIVPGLLQTPDYMRALLGKVTAFYGHDEPLDDGIAARLERQQVLRRGNHRFNLVTDVRDHPHRPLTQLQRLLLRTHGFHPSSTDEVSGHAGGIHAFAPLAAWWASVGCPESPRTGSLFLAEVLPDSKGRLAP
ncbi:Scr1 family TA system antitoxin-like transcriptional regulator [Nocardia amamiensis]|uniref:Scr1 family TA system antitoxin-like transcriptional regulator n=1 Tax=Nocardia amamiensis TaxID=404578 RepID=UPI00082BD762|nr:Scr1 family TA system antitoxin-like transcriptional regulator [Nocardia amamiensis]